MFHFHDTKVCKKVGITKYYPNFFLTLCKCRIGSNHLIVYAFENFILHIR